MFWLISFPGVQLLIVMWVLQLMYTAYATVKSTTNHHIKSLVIILLFVSCYLTIYISKNWLGTPSFTDDEVIGTLNGFDQFMYEGKTELAIMITTKNGPFMFAIPFDSQSEKDLQSSINREATTGKPTIVRKRSTKQQSYMAKLDPSYENDEHIEQQGPEGTMKTPGSSKRGGGQLEFYDFTDQMLKLKHQPQLEEKK
jgi:hypothetical protein